jgi:hypothetical protein
VLNQADHRATGWAVLDAVRDAGNRWVFPELLAEGLGPWGGVTQVWAAGSPDARHGVDITATFAYGVASLRAHEAYLRGLGAGAFDPEAYLAELGRAAGVRLGTRYGAAFEVLHCATPSRWRPVPSRGGAQGGALSPCRARKARMRMVAASQRGDSRHSATLPPPCALHTLIRCATPEHMTPGGRERAACRTLSRVAPCLVGGQAR